MRCAGITCIAYFFGGAFWVNAIPHFTNGVSGGAFPSPFASPPGQGESSAIVNVAWGAFNLPIGYLLTRHVGQFRLRGTREVAMSSLGGLIMALMLARALGQIYGGT